MEETFPDLGSLNDSELKDLIESLTEEEQEISYRRRVLHGKIDILRAELVNRLRKKDENGELVISGADVQLEFSTVNGRHYRIEAAPKLASPSWVTVVTDALGTGSPLTIIHPGGAQLLQHFYRVALQP